MGKKYDVSLPEIAQINHSSKKVDFLLLYRILYSMGPYYFTFTTSFLEVTCFIFWKFHKFRLNLKFLNANNVGRNKFSVSTKYL